MRLISADSHVNEPPDLWVERVPAAMKDRAPRIKSFEQGDAWVIEGVEDPITFGMNACAGLAPEDMKGWLRFEEIRHGGWDPAVRLQEMDADGTDAEVLYPTPRLSQAIVANTDVDYHVAMIRAYNDWLADYVAYAPARFGGLVLLPNAGAESAVAELERNLGRPGIRGAVIGCWPNGTLELKDEDDKVFARMAEAGLPLSIHVSLNNTMPSAHKAKLPGYGRFYDAPNRMIEMIFAGVFDRHPDLDVVFAEVDCGWVPYVKEQIDNNYSRLEPVSRFGLHMLPSEYIERHFHYGFMTDTFAIDNRHRIGIDRILWSSDYPHISSDWPNSWRTIQATFSGVPVAERDQILAGNSRRLYKFD